MMHYFKVLGTGKHWKMTDLFVGERKELPSMGRTSVDKTLLIFIHTFN